MNAGLGQVKRRASKKTLPSTKSRTGWGAAFAVVDGAKGNDSTVVIDAEEEAGREQRGTLDEQTKGEGAKRPSAGQIRKETSGCSAEKAKIRPRPRTACSMIFGPTT